MEKTASDDDYSVNQRVREIIIHYFPKEPDEKGGFPGNVNAFAETFKLGRPDTLYNVVRNKNMVKTDLLRLIIQNVEEVKHEKINGHWLLTGEGAMMGHTSKKLDIESTVGTLSRRIINLEDSLAEVQRKLSKDPALSS